MPLMEKLLSRAVEQDDLSRKVIVRVLLDDQGRVQDVVLKRSCGHAGDDARAMADVRNMRFAPGKVGSKTARRWHELAYSVGPEAAAAGRADRRERRAARSPAAASALPGIRKLWAWLARLSGRRRP
jgi:TonB family protein